MARTAHAGFKVRPLGKTPLLRKPRLSLSSSMSANAIARQFPQAEALFVQWRIDRSREGYDSLDELAWRRGMDERHVLNQLREIVEVFPGAEVAKD